MQFSDTTNKNGIIQKCEFFCGLGDAGISGDTTLLKQFTGLINEGYLLTVGWVLESEGNYQWDDSNYTNLPVATLNLVNGQIDYTLPTATASEGASTFLRLVAVDVKDSSGKYKELRKKGVHDSEVPLDRQFETDGLPQYYEEIGNSIRLYPAPDTSLVTATAGLRFHFERTPDLFTTSDTTQEPGISAPYHIILPKYASLEWLKVERPDDQRISMYNSDLYTPEIGLRDQMQKHYTNRNRDDKPKMTMKYNRIQQHHQ